MSKLSFGEVVELICQEDTRYDKNSYTFVREGLDFTLKTLKRNSNSANRHVTGNELLEGLRQHTLREFGPMSKMVLNEWGIEKCEDFGNIVFNLVNHNVLGKSDSDSLDDFKERYTFYHAFVQPFLPAEKPKLVSTRKAKSNQTRRANTKKASPKTPSSEL
ncbi:MAG: Minf_1886 family protein [Verrucomicrobiota bacterium]